ncbi:MAG TPA: RagB/SusD family nutrient uptake outer membrane protein, partial [Porphyromonadaceae bacterium]|nr:RagB/SusD family nutrient uptake outer membrane protein [Porphyromonadaceae bacterium]
MKKSLFIFSIWCLAVAWIGCDDMLNVTSKTDFTDDNFWKTETDLKAACNRLYQQFSPLDYDLRADDQVGRFNPNEISNGSWSIPAQSGDWTNSYACIFTANNILVKAGNAPISESILNRYLSEARFFRAWYYFELVCKYGDVPLVIKPFAGTTDPELKMPRTPRETVIQQCYDDLLFAAEWLPTRADMEAVNDEFDRRRITRSSALALIVRIGLHEGTMLKYHNLSTETVWRTHLQKSIDAYNLLKAEGHELYTKGGPSVSYLALFFDEVNSNNKEVIFSKAYGPNGITGTNASLHTHSYSCDVNFNITRSMVDYYLYADG